MSAFSMIDLAGRTYLVTGASKGFGLAIAKALLDAGANVGMLARGEVQLHEVVASLGCTRAAGFACDVRECASVQKAFAAVKAHFGALHGVINNAGLARPGSIEAVDVDELLLQVQTNFVGTVLGCQAAIPLLRGADNPRIVNISSASAWHYDEMQHLSIYAATKAAVERLTRDLRREVQADGIGVTCVRPGAAWTSFAEDWNHDALTAGIRAWQATGPTMDQGMEVDHVAQAVLYALSHPAGVAVDLLEVRPNMPVPKASW